MSTIQLPMSCQNLILRVRIEVSSHGNQLNSANWRYLSLSQHAPAWKSRVVCTIFFLRESARDPCFSPHLPLPQIPGPFFSGAWKEPPPPYKLSRALRRKNLCGRYPNCLPTSWTDTGWVNTTGFWLLCLQEHGEPPVTNAYVFGCFSASRCQISYPWLHTFSGYRLISSSEVHRSDCTPQYLGQYCWIFFLACCWYCVRFSVSGDADFMRWGDFFSFFALSCCYIYIFLGDSSRRLQDQL